MLLRNCKLWKESRYQLPKASNKTLRKLKNKDVEINIPHAGNMRWVEIFCYTDATHATFSSGSSQEAYFILLSENGKVILYFGH